MRGSNLGGAEIFRTRLDRPPEQRVPGNLAGDEAAGAWRWPPPSNAEVKEIIELNLYSPSGSPWPVLGRNFYISYINFDGTCWQFLFLAVVPTHELVHYRPWGKQKPWLYSVRTLRIGKVHETQPIKHVVLLPVKVAKTPLFSLSFRSSRLQYWLKQKKLLLPLTVPCPL